MPLFVRLLVVQEMPETVMSVGQGARYGASRDPEHLGNLGFTEIADMAKYDNFPLPGRKGGYDLPDLTGGRRNWDFPRSSEEESLLE